MEFSKDSTPEVDYISNFEYRISILNECIHYYDKYFQINSNLIVI